VVIKWKYEIN